ncbi:hypothetical protein [Propioniciclava soli]|uniref:hypothetical protein n=1 Tax=Propioniciclava soli TaxID=2775081 RepID=UPI001E4988E3|nr:hypothetical protein [Propioniciclava soli]
MGETTERVEPTKPWGRLLLVIIVFTYLVASLTALLFGLFRQCEDQVVEKQVILVCRPPALTDPPIAWLSALALGAVLVILNYSISSISVGGDKWFEVRFSKDSSTVESTSTFLGIASPDVGVRGLDSFFSTHQVSVVRMLLLGAASAVSELDSFVYCFYCFGKDLTIGYAWASAHRSFAAPRTFEGLVGSQILLDWARRKRADEGTSNEWVNHSPEDIDNYRLCYFTPVRKRSGERMGVLAVIATKGDGENRLRSGPEAIRVQLEAAAQVVSTALA